MTYEPRLPTGEEEAFAWGFMLGYFGEASEELTNVLPELAESLEPPDQLTDLEKWAWKRGYDAGVATFCDHVLDLEEV